MNKHYFADDLALSQMQGKTDYYRNAFFRTVGYNLHKAKSDILKREETSTKEVNLEDVPVGRK